MSGTLPTSSLERTFVDFAFLRVCILLGLLPFMKKKFFAALLLLLCVYGMGSAFYRGSASAWYYKAEFALNHWAKVGTIPNEDDYIEALDAITTASRLDPSHPHYIHMLGRIHHWGVSEGFESVESLPQIEQWYLASTKLRPMWPDPWVDLARLNNFVEGYTAKTKHYIDQAINTGPYIDDVNTGVLKVLLQHWDILDGNERELLFSQFQITTLQPKVLRLALVDAKSLGRQDLLCTQLRFNPEHSKYRNSGLYRQFCSNAFSG
ncbi:hypothetical protein GCM10007978_10240 [Shewanella hanedai]|uniref:Tetratricopeptide repeat protein n=1 Tax=Shewanella hanedai TaxID=25 RepID=A0A553JRQ6_SHEHA|nr:VpsP family polysaccharide biosynthesis protein [Shewanella hanedai]TRY15144.1 hypothetical protein FN961_05585 [Shewanella hanedai]GGI74410.1 hypothetical protein GCM10007978_10240 [Shewanella hanedai]